MSKIPCLDILIKPFRFNVNREAKLSLFENTAVGMRMISARPSLRQRELAKPSIESFRIVIFLPWRVLVSLQLRMWKSLKRPRVDSPANAGSDSPGSSSQPSHASSLYGSDSSNSLLGNAEKPDRKVLLVK